MAKKKTIIKVFEGFAGYGGASFAMKRLNKQLNNMRFEVVGYSEIDSSAIALYNANHTQKDGTTPIKNWGDISKIDEKDSSLSFDMFTGGFPCQPFSTVGNMMGEDDDKGRGSLFRDIIRICEKVKPKYILLENVVTLCRSKKFSSTYTQILSELDRIGFHVEALTLNSKDYGTPQNRERLWLFGIRKDFMNKVPDEFDVVPPSVELKNFIEDYLDDNPDESLYRTQQQIDHIKEKYGLAQDFFDVEERFCYDYYNQKIRRDRISMTITPPNHNVVRIVEPRVDGKDRVRKPSIDEHFRLMCFQIDDNRREIVYPEGLTYNQLGARAGNGWEINVVTALLGHIFKSLKL